MHTAPHTSNERNPATNLDKVEQYGWAPLDTPGKFMMLDKNVIEIDDRYQREAKSSRVLKLARRFKWITCGVIVVAKRKGRYYAVDGQHRVLAALKRADIKTMPCLVFETTSVLEEAIAFKDANSDRGVMTNLDRWKANLMANDPTTKFVHRLVEAAGRTISAKTAGPSTVCCVSAMLRCAQGQPAALERVWPVIVSVCHGKVLHERIVDGLVYIEAWMHDGMSLTDRRWSERIQKVGYAELLSAGQMAAAYYKRGGARVWALGMSELLNKGCRNRIVLRGADDHADQA